MNPTPTTMMPSAMKLATLAASLPIGSPEERVRVAFAIWKESISLIGYERAERDWLDLDAEYKGPPQPLADILKELMPTRDASDRKKTWREYLRSADYCNPPLDNNEVETDIGNHRERGVPNPLIEKGSFERWYARQASEKASQKSKKAAEARYAKAKKLAEEKKAAELKAAKKQLMTGDYGDNETVITKTFRSKSPNQKKSLGASKTPEKLNKQEISPAKQEAAPAKHAKGPRKQKE